MLERILILIAIVGAAIALGYGLGIDHEQAKQARTLRADLAAKDQAIERERTINGAISSELSAERSGREKDRIDFQRRLKNANGKPLVVAQCPAVGAAGVSQSAAAPVRDVVFTADFAGLWDDALSIGASEAERSRRIDGGTAGAGFSPDDILGNLAENAERWAGCRTQVRGWQSWACQKGFAADAQCHQGGIENGK